MERTRISIKALEVFLAVSRRGAVRDAADTLGISISTASHHLSELERTAGMALFDHGRRPMVLTPAGAALQKRVEEAMGSLRRGFAEIWTEDVQSLVRGLRIALIEDFDADVGPALAERLIRAAPQCEFSFLSRPTHEILELLESEQIDIGVATTADIDSSGITETPLLRDPFVLVLPATVTFTPNSPLDFMALSDTLPFLRYSSRQLIGRRVEAQLRRIGARFDRRMEFETSHVILSLVAAARGWTVTTALSFARAQRYHSSLRVMPFPGSAFSRDISVYTREDVPEVIATMSADTMRAAIRHMVIDPTCGRYPWLSETFRILSYTASDPESGGANASANSRIVPKESENAP